MEIHKPKPVHSWREFLTEIGTIVIGVLIALAAEQIVEAIHWKHQVTEARAILTDEIAGAMQGGVIQMRATACVEHRLDELESILDSAAASGRLPPVGDISQPPTYGWPHGAWDSFVGSQAASHLDRQELADIGTDYMYILAYADAEPKMVMAWSKLENMVGPGRLIDREEVATLRAAITEARTTTRLVAFVGLRVLSAGGDNLALTPAQAAQINAAYHAPQLPICAPVGAVPTAYGQGLGSASSMQLLESTLKHPPSLRIEG